MTFMVGKRETICLGDNVEPQLSNTNGVRDIAWSYYYVQQLMHARHISGTV